MFESSIFTLVLGCDIVPIKRLSKMAIHWPSWHITQDFKATLRIFMTFSVQATREATLLTKGLRYKPTKPLCQS